MELVKNIFFNTDRLVPGTKVKISYTGKFFQDNSEKVFIRNTAVKDLYFVYIGIIRLGKRNFAMRLVKISERGLVFRQLDMSVFDSYIEHLDLALFGLATKAMYTVF